MRSVVVISVLMAIQVAAMHLQANNLTELRAEEAQRLREQSQHLPINVPTHASVSMLHRRVAATKMIRGLTNDVEFQRDLAEILEAYGRLFDPCTLRFVTCSAHGSVKALHLVNVTGSLDLSGLDHDVEVVTVINSTVTHPLAMDAIAPTVKELQFHNVSFDGVSPFVLAFSEKPSLLRKFTCSRCGVNQIDWAHVPRLTRLDVSLNPLRSFSFAQLPATLTQLNISHCGIIAPVEQVISTGLPRSLRSIDASYNGLSGPLCAEWHEGLERVWLSNNSITGELCAKVLPNNLIVLDLSRNALKGAVHDMSALWALEVLDLRWNQLSDFASWGYFSHQLKQALLSHNQLTSLPSLAQLPPQLEVLDVSHNHIESTADLTRLPDPMRYLDLSFNAFSGPVNIETLPDGVEYVFLQSNRFTGSLALTEMPVMLRAIVFHSNHWDVRLPPEFS